ncbi:MAG TPA: hypothetical protein VN749_06920 [Candidatus Eisenbacteria bacterium]|nr:hypothetical protein [Candidatus Eisenbacteria bacterium]
METLSAEVLEELRQGRSSRENKLAVCTGGVQIAAPDLAEVLSVLALDPDELVASRARDSILSLPIQHFVEALNREQALEPLFQYAATNLAGKPAVLNAMIKNKSCGAEHLLPIVPHLSTLDIQALMDELERVVDSRDLVSALEKSSSVTLEQKAQLNELLSDTTPDQAALALAAEDLEMDEERRKTLLQQISAMTVAQRVKFAMKGGADARRVLIRDTNKVVQRAVLQSPRLTDQEVEAFASMTNLTDEILRLVGKNRNFRKNYSVVRNLLNNGKAPLDVTMNLLPMLNPMDLKRLTMNKNVPETLRTTAIKLQRQRSETKK